MTADGPPRSTAGIDDVVSRYARDRIDADTALTELRPYLGAADPVVRDRALGRAVAIAGGERERLVRIGSALAEGVAGRNRLVLQQSRSLRRLYHGEPTAIEPLLDHFEAVLRRDGARAGTLPLLVAACAGDLGERAPGVARRLVPALCAGVDANRERDGLFDSDVRTDRAVTEILSALARIGATEPAVVRPFVARQVWGLESDSPAVVARSLDNLGRVGLVLPWLVPTVDGLEGLLSHPTEGVREAAVRTVGRRYGVQRLDGDPVGVPDVRSVPDAVHGAMARAGADPVAAVRAATLRALSRLVTAEPSVARRHGDTLRAATRDTDATVRELAFRTLADVLEAGVTVPVDREAVLDALADDTDVRDAAVRVLAATVDDAAGEKRGRGRDHRDATLAAWSLLSNTHRMGSTNEMDGPVVTAVADALLAAGAAGTALVAFDDLVGEDREYNQRLDSRPRRARVALLTQVGVERPGLASLVAGRHLRDAVVRDEVREYALAGLERLQREGEGHEDRPARIALELLADPDEHGDWSDALSVLAAVEEPSPALRERATDTLRVLVGSAASELVDDGSDDGDGDEGEPAADDEADADGTDAASGEGDDGDSGGEEDDEADGDGSDDETVPPPSAVSRAIAGIVRAVPSAAGPVGEELGALALVWDTAVGPGVALKRGVAADELRLSRRRQRRLAAELLGDDDVPEAVRGHVAAALRCADTNRRVDALARRELFAVGEYEPTVLDGMAETVAEDAALAATAAGAVERFSSALDDATARAAAGHPTSGARLVARYAAAIEGLVAQFGDVTAVGAAETVGDVAPHALTDEFGFPLRLLVYGEADTAVDWLSLSAGRGSARHEQLTRFEVHPSPAVREAAGTTVDRLSGLPGDVEPAGDDRSDGEAPATPEDHGTATTREDGEAPATREDGEVGGRVDGEPDPDGTVDVGGVDADADADDGLDGRVVVGDLPPTGAVTDAATVDALARGLATASPAREAAVRERLVAATRERPALRDRIAVHLLARLGALESETRIEATADALATVGRTPTTLEGDGDRLVRRYLYEPEPEVRRAAVRALAAVFDRVVPETAGPDLRADLFVLLGDPDPVVRRLAADLIDRHNTLFEEPPWLVAALSALTDDLEPVAEAATDALSGLAASTPETVLRHAPALDRLVEVDDERREHALQAFVHLVKHVPELRAAVAGLPAVGGEPAALSYRTLLVLSSAPPEPLAADEAFLGQLVGYLTATTEELGAQLAGALLERLARRRPTVAVGPVADATGSIRDDEIRQARAEYALYRTAVALAERGEPAALEAAADGFEKVIDRATRSLSLGSGTNTREGGQPDVAPRTVRRVAATAAGTAGHESFLDVLAEFPDADRLPAPEPTAVARFLVRAAEADRETALSTVATEFGRPVHEAVVEELVSLSPGERGERARLEALAELLPGVEDRSIEIAGVGAVSDGLTAEDWIARRLAVAAVRELGTGGTVGPDEAVGQLVPRLTDANEQVAETAHDALLELCGRGDTTPAGLVDLALGRARRDDHPRWACRLVASLGTRYLAIRADVVDRLTTLATGTDDGTSRRAAAAALIEVATVDPAAVEPVRETLRTLAGDGDPNVRHYARECLGALGG